MERVAKRILAVLLVPLILALVLPVVASAAKTPKIDNFIILIDQSGSMAQKHPAVKQKKIDLAVDLVKKLDEAIPELGYKGGMAMFAPYQVVSPAATYKNGSLSSAVAGVDTDFYVFGRETPFGDGLQMSDGAIGGLSGKTALIVLTDGASNLGSDPVAQAKALYSKYGNKLCIHIVNMDKDPKGTAIIDNIRALNGCTVAADVKSLADGAALNKFVKAVFYADADGDDDGDGVPNSRDKCPNTLPGVLVDENGCALKHSMQIEFDFDKADIRPEYHDKIAEAAAFIKRYPKTRILVAGHTDSSGDAEYNKQLSMKRATALEAYLVEKFGINDAQLFPRGYGESRPIASNDTPEGRQQNRRVEFICCTVIPPE